MKRQMLRVFKIAVLSLSAVCAVAQITPSDDAYVSSVEDVRGNRERFDAKSKAPSNIWVPNGDDGTVSHQ